MSGQDTPGAPAAPAEEPRSRVSVARWAADLAMGGRFAVTGGRESWARTIMTAVGVGLGVALLLLASSVPNMYQQRNERGDARSSFTPSGEVKPGADTLRLANAGTTFRDQDITGEVMAPDGDGTPPVPPGIDRIPAAGEMWVSPALKKLLESDEGKLLRDRFPYRTIGVIGDSGLSGPSDLAYYAGISQKAFGHVNSSYHIDHWGLTKKQDGDQPLDPALLLLIIVGCVVLLLPVLIFIATAARFGGERRDRRLAALRLVGADIHMTRRIAAGESLFGSLFGLAVGAGMFLLAREIIGSIEVWDISFFTSDIVPSAPLALVIAVAVPASAVMVTLIALRGIAIEPLGVVRNAKPKRRRLWWRLMLPLLGLALLLPLAGGFGAGSGGGGDMKAYQAAAGAVLLLIGITALLPWVVESVVERFGGRGSVPWQLATRRLQLSSGTASRAVSGITVAVAGAIALQMLFASVGAQDSQDTGQDPNRAQLIANVPVSDGDQAGDAFARYRATKGVRDLLGVTEDYVSDVHRSKDDPSSVPEEAITVADCPTLREVVRITSCKNGDVFLIDSQEYYGEGESFAKPGAQVNLAYRDDGTPDLRRKKLWTIPDSATKVKPRQDPTGSERTGIFATPGAFDIADLPDPRAAAMIRLDPKVPDGVEYVRNTSMALSPAMDVMRLSSTSQSDEFQVIRKALFIGATATLLLIGASMIVTTLEQLRERKRLLSVLVAFGTRRTTLSWSVLWQTAVPVVLGLALSIAGGLALGVMLLKMIGQPLAVDWTGLTTMTGVGGGVILLVTLVSLPPLWRIMRPEGLRTE
ncbi:MULTISPECIES: ABC transporter permease [Streptomyces violaceusniger group]|uniref:ABC transporter permease n=2 Tax=Streptomyces javensis TaxID=114698 RepID=A0ABN1X427_9ACTN|nr:ABC transporter permease [Streptomyces javensis]MBI0314498.1 ABC transporter permease [Streptomyces javensis]